MRELMILQILCSSLLLLRKIFGTDSHVLKIQDFLHVRLIRILKSR